MTPPEVSCPSYVELRAHTAFSFGDGSVTPETLVERAAALGYDAIGITDTADVGGLVRAVLAGRERHVRILAGAELRVDGRPMAFLARDADGYRNLAALVTQSRVGAWGVWDKAQVGKGRGRPNVTRAQLFARSTGLHALTGPASGALASLVRAGDLVGAERWLGEWREIFGERLAVEVQLHHAGGAEAALAGAMIGLAERCTVTWAVKNDTPYVDESSRVVHDLLTASPGYGCRRRTPRVPHPNGEWRLPACRMRQLAGTKRGSKRARTSPRVYSRSTLHGCDRRSPCSTSSWAAMPTTSFAGKPTKVHECAGVTC
jgi:DNA polymerase III alpha subunit